jgi:tetratricopeptide (TPR) repeat protein
MGVTTGADRVPGDVVTIVEKCLDKDPERRYRNADELADDLDRYLTSQPIQARPPTALYQLRMLVQRHRVVSGFVATVFLLLVAFGVIMTEMYRRQTHERERANREAEKAQLVNEFLAGVLDEANAQAGGRLGDRIGIVDEASRRIESELGDDPLLRAEVLELLVRHSTGSDLTLDLHRRAALARAEAISVVHRETEEGMSAIRGVLAGKRSHVSAEVFENLGRSNDRRLRSDLLGLGDLLQTLAFTLQYNNRPGEAEPIAVACLALATPLLGEPRTASDTEEDDAVDRVQFAHKLLVQIYRKQWKLAEAEQIARDSVEFDRRTAGEDSLEASTSLILLGLVQLARNRLDEAEVSLRGALLVLGPLLEGELVRTSDTVSAATAILRLGDVMRRRGRHAEAESLVTRAVDLRKKLTGTESPLAGEALLRLSEVYASQDEMERAVATARQGARLSSDLRGRDDVGFCRANFALGRILQLAGEPAEAEDVLRQALGMAREVRGFGAAVVAEGTLELGSVLLDRGQREEAADLLRESVSLWASLVPEGEFPLVEAVLLLAIVEEDAAGVASVAEIVAERGDPLKRQMLLERTAAFLAGRSRGRMER